MILSERLDSIQVQSLVSKLLACSSSDVVLIYDSDNRFFSVVPDSSDFKPSTIEEERAFASGGCHATPSECSL